MWISSFVLCRTSGRGAGPAELRTISSSEFVGQCCRLKYGALMQGRCFGNRDIQEVRGIRAKKSELAALGTKPEIIEMIDKDAREQIRAEVENFTMEIRRSTTRSLTRRGFTAHQEHVKMSADH